MQQNNPMMMDMNPGMMNMEQMMMPQNNPMMMDMNPGLMNIDQMMMQQNNQMMMNMNPGMMNSDQMMIQQNNQMMMNMMMQQILEQNKLMMMGMNHMMNMKETQNLDKPMTDSIVQNNPYLINLNDFYKKHQTSNCKFVKLLCDNQFIADVPIYNPDYYSKLIPQLTNILYCCGKELYRRPSKNEIVQRTFPFETLELLLERGVVDFEHWRIIISHKGHMYYSEQNIKDIQNGDRLNVTLEGKIIGGGALGGIEFIDVDGSTKTKKLQIVKDAPKWRLISKGLNIFGKCSNKKCKVFEKEVAHNAGINKKFDFNEEIEKIKCPICSHNFLPITMGFYQCEYLIKGKKFKDGKYETVDINGKETNGDDFEYFDPYKSKTATWPILTIFTGHKQKMKYSKTPN